MRVVIAEDSVLLREGLRHILADAGHEVVAGVGDAEALLASVGSLRPDLVITDVRMPPTFTEEGLGAAVALRARYRELPVVVLSQYIGQAYAVELLEANRAAIGYLLKDRIADVAQFVRAVEQVAGGEVVVDHEVVRRLLANRRASTPLQTLTPREREVLEVMARGRSNAAIGAELRIGDVAVAKHVGNIFAKLMLPPAPDDHRRVLAVLAYLQSSSTSSGPADTTESRG
jgi:DNA-binding NarL/FixJ family response regulator